MLASQTKLCDYKAWGSTAQRTAGRVIFRDFTETGCFAAWGWWLRQSSTEGGRGCSVGVAPVLCAFQGGVEGWRTATCSAGPLIPATSVLWRLPLTCESLLPDIFVAVCAGSRVYPGPSCRVCLAAGDARAMAVSPCTPRGLWSGLGSWTACLAHCVLASVGQLLAESRHLVSHGAEELERSLELWLLAGSCGQFSCPAQTGRAPRPNPVHPCGPSSCAYRLPSHLEAPVHGRCLLSGCDLTQFSWKAWGPPSLPAPGAVAAQMRLQRGLGALAGPSICIACAVVTGVEAAAQGRGVGRCRLVS